MMIILENIVFIQNIVFSNLGVWRLLNTWIIDAFPVVYICIMYMNPFCTTFRFRSAGRNASSFAPNHAWSKEWRHHMARDMIMIGKNLQSELNRGLHHGHVNLGIVSFPAPRAIKVGSPCIQSKTTHTAAAAMDFSRWRRWAPGLQQGRVFSWWDSWPVSTFRVKMLYHDRTLEWRN